MASVRIDVSPRRVKRHCGLHPAIVALRKRTRGLGNEALPATRVALSDQVRDGLRVSPPSSDRSGRWLPLLRELTETSPNWMALKGATSAFSRGGDIDSIAPGEDWATIQHVFHRWARSQGLGPVVPCRHAPFLLHLVALDPVAPSETFYELDVNRRKIFLGSTLFRPSEVSSLAIVSDQGFRRLRPGAEGLLKLVQNGMHRGGRMNAAGLQIKGILPLLQDDWEGVMQMAHLFKQAERDVLRGARAAADGGWDRRSMIRTEAWSLARAAIEPSAVFARLKFRYNKGRCPVLRSVFESKRIVGPDPSAWLEHVAESHEVLT